MNGEVIGKLCTMEKAQRDEILMKTKESEVIALHQTARVTSLSLNMLYSA